MVKLSAHHNMASKSQPPMAISPVKTPVLPTRVTKPTFAKKLKTFDPNLHDGEVMACPLVGVERFPKD